MHNRDRSIDVSVLSRVEGEGSLHIVVQDGTVVETHLDIFEPPRFFEALLVGRRYEEVPDITARICGICPVAYQMTACGAVEDAYGAPVSPAIAALRRLLYCGEWLQSHALHVYFLHAPDFFGCEDALQLAALAPSDLQRGITIKKAGNEIMSVIGGRAVHPVNVRVGGFYRAPSPGAVAALKPVVERALEAAVATLDWVTSFDFPEMSVDYEFVALRGQGRYPIEAGTVSSSGGLQCSAAEFADIAVEEHAQRTTALQSRLYGRRPYLTGPLARYALNSDLLTPLASSAAARAGLGPVCRNPFRSIVVRAVEMIFACEEALLLIGHYEPPAPAWVALGGGRPGCAGASEGEGGADPAAEGLYGAAATEAPRGLLLHAYRIGADGLVRQARIMPPTSQNQLSIESDLSQLVKANLDMPSEELQRRAEMAVRNHDPCISCATHFLHLSIETRP